MDGGRPGSSQLHSDPNQTRDVDFGGRTNCGKRRQTRNSSGSDTHTTGSTPDQAAQQNILSVFLSVISMQSMACHSVSEQLMAAGATDEDVKNISQITAQTVRQLEAGSMPPEPGLEAHSLPCEVVGSDEEFSTGEYVPGSDKIDIEGQEAIKRSLSNVFTEKRRLAKKCKQEGEGM